MSPARVRHVWGSIKCKVGDRSKEWRRYVGKISHEDCILSAREGKNGDSQHSRSQRFHSLCAEQLCECDGCDDHTQHYQTSKAREVTQVVRKPENHALGFRGNRPTNLPEK